VGNSVSRKALASEDEESGWVTTSPQSITGSTSCEGGSDAKVTAAAVLLQRPSRAPPSPPRPPPPPTNRPHGSGDSGVSGIGDSGGARNNWGAWRSGFMAAEEEADPTAGHIPPPPLHPPLRPPYPHPQPPLPPSYIARRHQHQRQEDEEEAEEDHRRRRCCADLGDCCCDCWYCWCCCGCRSLFWDCCPCFFRAVGPYITSFSSLTV